jgi:hypothetical protein
MRKPREWLYIYCKTAKKNSKMAKDLEKVSQQEQSFQVKHYTTQELKELFGDVFSKKKVSREIENQLFNDEKLF